MSGVGGWLLGFGERPLVLQSPLQQKITLEPQLPPGSTEQPTLPGSMGVPGGLGLSLSRCLAWFQDMFNRNRAKGGARIPAQLGAGL